MPAPQAVLELVERFERNRESYKSPSHNETQLRRYAWSAKLPLSILTDVEEFAVYDCRIKPDKNDKSSPARTLCFTWKQYAEKRDRHDTTIIQRQIDRLVYELYGLTEEEIGVVEGR